MQVYSVFKRGSAFLDYMGLISLIEGPVPKYGSTQFKRGSAFLDIGLFTLKEGLHA